MSSSSSSSASSITKDALGIRSYYSGKIDSLELLLSDKQHNLRRLEAQRNDLNLKVRRLRDEIDRLQEPGSSIGEVVKVMNKKKVLCKIQPDGKYIVDVSANIDINKLTPGTRVALRNDSYQLHKVLPTKIDPLVSLMRVEKVPDATYDMVGGLEKQVREMKEVIELPIKHPELFEALGIAQPKGVIMYGPPGTGKTLLARAVAHHTDCFSGDSLVNMNGFGIPIKLVKDGGFSYAFDESKKQIVPSTVLMQAARGVRDCIQLAFEDGRTIECTKDHRFMTTAGWKVAGELFDGGYDILFGPSYPKLILGDKAEQGWSLTSNATKFDLQSMDNAIKALVFVRLIGYVLSNGYCGGQQTSVFLGHELDVAVVLSDIQLLTNKQPTASLVQSTGTSASGDEFQSVTWRITLPIELHQLIVATGISQGDRHKVGYTLPSFIVDSSCPPIVIAAFLQGLFSGDGHTTALTKPSSGTSAQFRELAFSSSCDRGRLSEHCDTINAIKQLLLRIGINGIGKTSFTDHDNGSVDAIFNLDIDMIPKFEELVGFPYCVDKAARLSVAAACLRAKTTMNQFEWIKDHNASSFFNMGIGGTKATAREPKKVDSGVKRGEGINCFTMKVVNQRLAGVKTTYDLQMNGNPSFTVAGAVVHNCCFIRVSGSELVQKYIGEGSRMVREIFVMARQHAPSIIFMDEIDSIGGTRLESGSGGDSEVQRTMLELLNQLDGFEPSQNIKVLMATNRIDILDPALLRPGRIDRKVEFPNPNESARLHILKIHSRRMNLMRGINLRKVARKMLGASGAEMKAVCTEAGMFALRERRVHVTQEDFEMAVTKVLRKDAEKEMSQIQFWK